jgi:hypothetical protein
VHFVLHRLSNIEGDKAVIVKKKSLERSTESLPLQAGVMIDVWKPPRQEIAQ